MNTHLQQTRGVIIMSLYGSAIYFCESYKHRLVCAREKLISTHYRIKVHFHHRSIISTASVFLTPRLNKPIVEHHCRNSVCSPRYSAACFFQPKPHLPIGSASDSGQNQRGEGLICYACGQPCPWGGGPVQCRLGSLLRTSA